MITQELLDYIKQQTQEGVSSDSIKNTLLSNDWKEVDINKAFNNLAITHNNNDNTTSELKEKKIFSGVFFLISLIVLSLIAIFFLINRVFNNIFSERGFLEENLIVYGGMIVVGILFIFTVINFLKYKNWARWMIIFFSLAGIVLFGISIFENDTWYLSKNVYIILVLGIVVVYLIFNSKVKYSFKSEENIVSSDKKILWVFIPLLLSIGMIIIGLRIIVAPDKVLNQTLTVISPTKIPIVNPSDIEKSPSIEESIKGLSPKESYLIMEKDADNLKTFTDLEAYILKHGNKKAIAELGIIQKEIKDQPHLFNDQFFSEIINFTKGPLSNEITTIEEIINGNTAILNVQTIKPELTGVINLTLEDGQWKLEGKHWNWKQ